MSDLLLIFLQYQLNSFYMLGKVSICRLSGLDMLEVRGVVVMKVYSE